MDSAIQKDGTQLLNNKNGGDEKCSQCACFWLKIIKEILFGVGIYYKILSTRELSIGEGNIIKKNNLT